MHLVNCGEKLKRTFFIALFSLLAVAAFSSEAATTSNLDGVKFENDFPVMGCVVDWGPDYITIISPLPPFVVTFEEIANIASYTLPLMAAVVKKSVVEIQTSVAELPSGKRERRIMQMRFLSPHFR